MSGSIAPQWLLQFFDDVGNIASGAKLYSYVAGTTEPTPLYADYACTTPIANPYSANAAGRANVWLKNGISYRLRVEDADGNVLCDRWPIIGGTSITAESLRDIVGDSEDITWVLSPDGATLIGSVVDAGMAKNEAGGVSRYHGDLHSNDLDILFRVNPDTGKLDSVMYQGTGLGARLLQVAADFEFAGWEDGYLYGGRGIAAGYAWVGEVGSQEHVRVWRCNDAAAHMYQTRDNWATSVHDTSAVALLVGVRPPCLAYIEINGVSCWVLTSASGGHWWYAQDIAANYNADGTLKAAAWNAGANMAPHQIADIAESPDGGFRLVGNHNYIMKTTDWVTFTDVYNAGTILGGIDTDKAGKWVAVGRDSGVIAMSIDDGDTWSWPTIYKRNGEDGEYVAAGNIHPSGCVAYANGRWLITSSYNAGYAYSEDGIYWTVFDSPLGEFYGVASDGVRFYATNPTKVGTGAQNVVYRLLVSEIPFHRHTVHEKGATVDQGLWVADVPNVPILGTDHRGRIIDGTAELSRYFVDLATNQTVDGVKTFSDGVVADSLKITNQAGPVARMVQAGTDGTQSAVSAATARSTIGLQRNGGREWDIYPTSRTAYSDFRYSQMAWSGAVFVQVSKESPATLYRYSSDALTWTEASMPVLASWQGIAWCASSSLFVAVGYTGGGTGVIYTSPNGVTWTARTVSRA